MIAYNQSVLFELWRAVNENTDIDRASETPRDRYLRFATEAEALAKEASRPVHRKLCLDIARFWRQMAMTPDDDPPQARSNVLHWPGEVRK